MEVLGIITEYNPFHNGHLYHIQKSKEITGADFVILVMSGSFTQTGNITIIDKYKRANIATKYGVDLVIELPTIFATSSAEYFARGAINLLNNLGIVDCICFGSEENDIQKLKDLANILITNEDIIFENIKLEQKKGISFPLARELAINKLLNEAEKSIYTSILSKPNNILGLEYLKALKYFNSPIKPYLIHRVGNVSHNDTNILNLNKTSFTSATSIRKELQKDIYWDISNYVPKDMYDILNNSNLCFNNNLFKLLKYKITTSDIEYIRNIHEVTEGLENKITKAIIDSKSYDELVENIKSKRYTKTKIKRVLINILLGISKDYFKEVQKNNISYAHILALGENGKLLLSEISKNKKINFNVLTSINEKKLNEQSINDLTKKSLNLDISATNIHSILSDQNLNLDYTNKLI